MYYNPFSNALQYSQQPGADFSTRPNPYYDATQANSRELLDWMVGSEISLDSEADLYVFDLTLTGDVGENMGSFAAGYQFRRFEAEATPNRDGDLSVNPCRVNKDQAPSASDADLDCAENNKDPDSAFIDGQIGTFGFVNGNFPYSTHQTTHSFFGEWAHDLSDTMSTQLAVHYEEHDESSTFDPKAALLWDVSDSITLRGSVQTTFRAPSVDDLNEDAFYRQEWVAGAYKPIEVRGDKGLDPEEALTYNIGMFAEFGSGVELTLDYWKYIFDDPITATPHGAIQGAYENHWSPTVDAEQPSVQRKRLAGGRPHRLRGGNRAPDQHRRGYHRTHWKDVSNRDDPHADDQRPDHPHIRAGFQFGWPPRCGAGCLLMGAGRHLPIGV